MNRDEHRELRESLGLFALGLLPDGERTAVRAHLDGCPDCRAELAAIAPLATPLRDVDPARLGMLSTPPDDLRESIVERMRAERRRRLPVRALTGVAAAAVVLAAGFGVGYWVAPRPAPLPLEPVPVARQAPGIDVTADLVPHTWGTEIKLSGTGFAAGQTYRVTILDRSGRERVAGEFIGTGANSMVCNLNTAVLRDAATGFIVRGPADAVVATSTF